MFEVRRSSRHGRGLFATEPIARDTILMQAPVLLIEAEQREALQATIVDDYVYEWDDDGTAALVLGVSSMCNHADEPNAYLWLVHDGPAAELVAIADIDVDEEITVSYRAEAGPETGPLWFTVREP